MRDELDQILDEAVKSYAAIEPPPELPARILRQAQPISAPQRNHWRLALAIALPLAAALALAFVFAGRMNFPKPPTPVASQPPTPSVVIPKPPQPQETLATTRKPAVPVLARYHAHQARPARSWARPLPAPYSKEELALLTFVQQHPKEAAEIAEAQKQQVAAARQPIPIAPIQINPITIAALD